MVVIRVLLLYYLLERMPSAQRHELGEYGRSPQKEMLARISPDPLADLAPASFPTCHCPSLMLIALLIFIVACTVDNSKELTG